MKHKSGFRAVALAGAMLAGVTLFANTNTNKVVATSYSKAVTKVAGDKDYAIYHSVNGNGPTGKFTSTKYFKYGQIQSKQYQKTKKGTFWDIYVNGRHVGWVSQNFFARNKISVAKEVSLVQNPSYSFNTRDAINYATDSKGTAVNPDKVKVSQESVSSNATVTYTYGKASATVNVTVHPGQTGSTSKSAMKGFKNSTTWNGGSKGSSRNWNAAHGYRPETTSNTFKSGDLTLRTHLFEPRFVSLDYGKAGDAMGQVGVIPEGMTIRNNIFVTSMYNKNSDQRGHLVSYNLNAIKSKYAAQNLTTMSWSSFKTYSQNIKVSPYIKMGHGQSLGSSSSYIYVMANDNNYKNGPKSEEILQVRKSDMQIEKIWTFKIADNRYIHNATFTDDGTMYALFHNGGHHLYEYWKLTLSGDTWVPTQVGATNGDFITNSPVQGFAYGNGYFFIGFNDYIFKVTENGTAVKSYHFNTRREIEGMGVDGGQLYVQFAQRSELTSGKIK